MLPAYAHTCTRLCACVFSVCTSTLYLWCCAASPSFYSLYYPCIFLICLHWVLIKKCASSSFSVYPFIRFSILFLSLSSFFFGNHFSPHPICMFALWLLFCLLLRASLHVLFIPLFLCVCQCEALETFHTVANKGRAKIGPTTLPIVRRQRSQHESLIKLLASDEPHHRFSYTHSLSLMADSFDSCTWLTLCLSVCLSLARRCLSPTSLSLHSSSFAFPFFSLYIMCQTCLV